MSTLQSWVRCVCVSTFDIDKGQVLEDCFPGAEVRVHRWGAAATHASPRVPSSALLGS